ncbi:MAG: hypothetical protein WB952_24730 [Terriglobales bacterium]
MHYIILRLLLVLKHAGLWIVAALPDISNLILVLVGVVMSLPKLAERVEDNRRTRYGIASICILLGLGGFVVSVNQRQKSDKNMEALVGNVNTLTKEAGDLVKNTNNLVTSFTYLIPQIASQGALISDLNIKIEAAKEKHDPHVIADLQAKADVAKKVAEATANEFSVAMVPRISAQLRQDATVYELALIRVDDAYHDRSTMPESRRSKLPPFDKNKEKARVRKEYEKNLSSLIGVADYVRQQLLMGISETATDKPMAASFERAARGDLSAFDARSAAEYLDDLAKRNVPASPSGLSSTAN